MDNSVDCGIDIDDCALNFAMILILTSILWTSTVTLLRVKTLFELAVQLTNFYIIFEIPKNVDFRNLQSYAINFSLFITKTTLFSDTNSILISSVKILTVLIKQSSWCSFFPNSLRSSIKRT